MINADQHALIMAREATISEAINYADFNQPVDIQPAGDPSITDDNPDNELVEGLQNGNISTNGSDVIELMSGKSS